MSTYFNGEQQIHDGHGSREDCYPEVEEGPVFDFWTIMDRRRTLLRERQHLTAVAETALDPQATCRGSCNQDQENPAYESDLSLTFADASRVERPVSTGFLASDAPPGYRRPMHMAKFRRSDQDVPQAFDSHFAPRAPDDASAQRARTVANGAAEDCSNQIKNWYRRSLGGRVETLDSLKTQVFQAFSDYVTEQVVERFRSSQGADCTPLYVDEYLVVKGDYSEESLVVRLGGRIITKQKNSPETSPLTSFLCTERWVRLRRHDHLFGHGCYDSQKYVKYLTGLPVDRLRPPIE